jgi:hypothetical protein
MSIQQRNAVINDEEEWFKCSSFQNGIKIREIRENYVTLPRWNIEENTRHHKRNKEYNILGERPLQQ